MARSWPELAAVHERLGEAVADLPGVETEDSHGHRSFMLKGKRIAWLLVDHHGDDRLALWVKAPAGEQVALVGADPRRYFAPPYLGPSGWVGVNVDEASEPDWAQVVELLEQAWRMSGGQACGRRLRRRPVRRVSLPAADPWLQGPRRGATMGAWMQ